jgi:hypothetical protein
MCPPKQEKRTLTKEEKKREKERQKEAKKRTSAV